MNKRLIHRYQKDISDEIIQSDLHPVLKRIYSHRGVSSLRQVNYSLEHMQSLDQLKGLDLAVSNLKEAFIENKKNLFEGDFD